MTIYSQIRPCKSVIHALPYSNLYALEILVMISGVVEVLDIDFRRLSSSKKVSYGKGIKKISLRI